MTKLPLWYVRLHYWSERQRRTQQRRRSSAALLSRHLCLTAVALAFAGGLVVGLLLPTTRSPPLAPEIAPSSNRTLLLRMLRNKSASNESEVENSRPCCTNRTSDGVFWSDRVEALRPSGFRPEDARAWTEFANRAQVIKVMEGCGRMQNRLLVFENGTKSCCRYRQNNDQIQGEIYSYHLARLLGLDNLPPASLGLVHGRERQWSPVRNQLTLAQWNEQKPVVMTQFVDGLEPAYIPRQLRGDDDRRRLHPVRTDLETDQLAELIQWSDLIVFDYLTANLDRVVNNMYNRQWNAEMMSAPAHNLARQVRTGLLVFLDNESGLLHGYRLLDKYESYHRAMLDSLCVFRRSTAEAVADLHRAGDVGSRLQRALLEAQPEMAEWLPPLPERSVKILKRRIGTVHEQVKRCRSKYSRSPGT